MVRPKSVGNAVFWEATHETYIASRLEPNVLRVGAREPLEGCSSKGKRHQTVVELRAR